VRQGDPLSPLLFVSTAEILQYVINDAWQRGEIALPIDNDFGQKFPIIQYADDTLLIMPACANQLAKLKDILILFSDATGLKVNFHKTSLVPINITQEEAQNLASSFGCRVEGLPFTYLGLPLGTTKPSVDDLMPLVSRLDKRLSGISSLLSYTGRLTLLNTTLNAIPLYAMCTIKIPVTIFVHFEKSGRQFLWANKDDFKHGKCLASWDMVCKPKDQGGLGVLNLRIQNKALLMKNLYKFYNHQDIPWVNLIWQAYYHNINNTPHLCSRKGSFWWKDCLSMVDDFTDLTTCSVHKGNSISLWFDQWDNNSKKETQYPRLLSFAKNDRINLHKATGLEDLYDLFHLPLSIEAHQEFRSLQLDLNGINSSDRDDIWCLRGNEASFSTKKVYRALIGNYEVPKPILDIWKTCNIPRQKFFAWLLMNNRLNTKDLMCRKNFFVQIKDCVLCDTCPEETLMHLFFECSFSQSFWWAIGIEWNTDFHLIHMISDACQRYKMSFIMEIIISGCWAIWDQRNGLIFRDIAPSLLSCSSFFKTICASNLLRARPSLKEGMTSWIDTL
jgi:hypothetical protein